MFQGKAITAFGQGVVALIATVIFPLIALALLQTGLSIDESDRPQSVYYMPVCFFILGFTTLVIAIWRFTAAYRYSREIHPDAVNPRLASFEEDDLIRQEELERKLDEQTIRHNENAKSGGI